jgi:phosphoribosyl 1,2-cyclic phosphodiesterase
MLVSSPGAKILIDNGLSYRQLSMRCNDLGLSLDGLDGLFITHEHGDHVRGAGILARKMDIPVYMTRDTFAHLPKSIGKIPRTAFFESGEEVNVGDMCVGSFSVSHDAVDPVSFTVACGGCRIGLATDLGRDSALVRARLSGSHALILESNYCPKMLENSPYPKAVCQRIRSNQGHLSNPDMTSLLAKVLHDDLKLVVLVHVSQENNTEERAKEMAARVLHNQNSSARLVVAAQDRPTPVFEVAI